MLVLLVGRVCVVVVWDLGRSPHKDGALRVRHSQLELFFFILGMQHSQGLGTACSPLSASIAVFILEMQPSQGWGTASSPLSARIVIFILGLQPAQAWSILISPLSARILIFILGTQPSQGSGAGRGGG